VRLYRFVERRTAERELEGDLARLALAGEGRGERAVIAQLHFIEQLQALGGASESPPRMRIHTAVEVEGDLRAVVAAEAQALELGRQHAGIVDDEHIAGLQDLDEIGDVAVDQRLAWTDNEHACSVPRTHRVQRNAVGREVEVEFRNEHGRLDSRDRPGRQIRATCRR
jgi:hypothetical protein